MPTTLQIGVARADITPPVGIPMVGFAGRGPSIGVHDPLYATALVVADVDRPAVIIDCDLLGFKAETVNAFRQAISEATGIAHDQITLACTHSHYGPAVDRFEDSVLVAAYRENLKYQLAGLVQEASQNLVAAGRMGIGWGVSDIGINRREKRPDGQIVLGQNPDGPVDRQVGVARIEDTAGEPIVCLINFACHPVSQSGRMQMLSADFPGRMRQVVEGLMGVRCLFLQGAAGNINPIRMENAYEPARNLGTRLACEVVKVWETIETQELTDSDAPLKVVSKTVSLPRYMYDTLASAEQLAEEMNAQIQRLEAEGSSGGSLWWAKLRLERVNEAIESWKSGQALPEIEAELQAGRIGPLAFVTAPAEIFTENGEYVKRNSPFEHTFFVGYTNGSIGYVPTREAYPEGGYEVTHACQVDPEAGDLINAGCLELLAELLMT
jgi:neutral ceramidase